MPTCRGGGIPDCGWLSSESRRKERMCRSESVITLLKTGQRSMYSGELAAYNFRGSWSSARCSRPGLLPWRLLLPEGRSSRLLLLCTPVSKKELRSDRLEEIVDPPSCLISSNSEEIWPSRERISWLDESMGPLWEAAIGFLAAMASKYPTKEIATNKNLLHRMRRSLGIDAFNPLSGTVTTDGSGIVAPGLAQAAGLTSCGGSCPTLARPDESGLGNVHDAGFVWRSIVSLSRNGDK